MIGQPPFRVLVLSCLPLSRAQKRDETAHGPDVFCLQYMFGCCSAAPRCATLSQKNYGGIIAPRKWAPIEYVNYGLRARCHTTLGRMGKRRPGSPEQAHPARVRGTAAACRRLSAQGAPGPHAATHGTGP